MNSVQLMGRLGNDPEMRVTQSGTEVAKFRLAVPRGRDKETGWFDVVCFGKTASVAAQYLKKGQRVAITGQLRQERWTDQQTGQKRSRVGVMAERLHFIDWSSQEKPGDEAADDAGYVPDEPQW